MSDEFTFLKLSNLGATADDAIPLLESIQCDKMQSLETLDLSQNREWWTNENSIAILRAFLSEQPQLIELVLFGSGHELYHGFMLEKPHQCDLYTILLENKAQYDTHKCLEPFDFMERDAKLDATLG